MGRRKFRLADVMPNSWFYKLRDMRRAGGRRSAAGVHQSPQPVAGTPKPVPVLMPHRASYYFASRERVLLPPASPQTTTRAPAAAEDHHPQTQSPARSYRMRHRVGPVGKAAPVAETPPDTARRHHCRRDNCIGGRDGGRDVGKQSRRLAVSSLTKDDDIFTGKVIASDADIIFDLQSEDDVPTEILLRPIVTKPAKKREMKERHAVVDHAASATPRASSASDQGINKVNSRRSSVSSSGRRLKTRANSPRLAASRGRKGAKSSAASTTSPRKKTTPPPLAESFAVVKASVDPRRDFRESMEEMIAEKGIRGAGDLEDLLACYLALNAAEYHDLIVEVFEEIWASLAGGGNP